ncbi:MAG: hypothetical protein ACRCT1_10150 [Microcoleaceae cyanobacterium]
MVSQLYQEGRRKKEEGRRKKEEGRRKKEEGRRKKEEGRRKKEIIPNPQSLIINSQSQLAIPQFPVKKAQTIKSIVLAIKNVLTFEIACHELNRKKF